MEALSTSSGWLHERLAASIAGAERAGRVCVVLALTLGHAAIDERLEAAGSRLRANVGPRDTVARTGGGFIVVLGDLAGNHEAHRGARRIFELVSAASAVSAGFSIFPFTTRAPGELIDAACEAMHGVEAAGGNAVEPARPQVPRRDVSKIRACATSFPAKRRSGPRASGLASG